MMHRDDMVEAAVIGDLERLDVQLQRDYPDINHVHRKVGCPSADTLKLCDYALAVVRFSVLVRLVGLHSTKLRRTRTLK
jgi:hypothetical protein